MTTKEMFAEFGRGITLLGNKQVAIAFVVRIINQLSLFGLVAFYRVYILMNSALQHLNGYAYGD